MARVELGQKEQALDDVNQSLRLQPNNARAYELRAKIYRMERDYTRASADLDQALERDPRSLNYMLAAATLAEDRKDFGTAADLYKKAAAISTDPSIRIKHAAVLVSLDRLPEALAECSAVIAAEPNSAEGYGCRAKLLIRMNRFNEAVSDLNHTIRLNPDYPNAANIAATISTLQGLDAANDAGKPAATDKAVAAAVPAVRPAENPPAPPAAARVPAAVAETKTLPPPPPAIPPAASATPAAVASVAGTAPAVVAPVVPPAVVKPAGATPATDDKKAQARTLASKGNALNQKGQFEQAVEAVTPALELDPSPAFYYNIRGYALLRTGKLQPAIQDFDAAIARNPSFADAYWNRGVARRKAGDEKGGAQDMQKAVELGRPAESSWSRMSTQAAVKAPGAKTASR
jgi:tetratricopeptide (TPR) repeat protein